MCTYPRLDPTQQVHSGAVAVFDFNTPVIDIPSTIIENQYEHISQISDYFIYNLPMISFVKY